MNITDFKPTTITGRRKKQFTATVSALFLLVSLSACESTPKAPVYDVQARVLSVGKAADKCSMQGEKKSGSGQTLAGGLIGGILGNQFGSGNGRTAATVAGAILGAVVAAPKSRPTGKLVCKSDDYVATVTYIHPETQKMITENIKLTTRVKNPFIVIPVKGAIPHSTAQ